MPPATQEQIDGVLSRYPTASKSWSTVFYAAGFSVSNVVAYMETQNGDASSPLREAEEGLMGQEMSNLNKAMGVEGEARAEAGKMCVSVRSVLSPAEQSRVCRAVEKFCSPRFQTSDRIGKNGHAVMNCVRRCVTAYMASKIPYGRTVVELGPDVKNWLMTPQNAAWVSGDYVGARPLLTPRDCVRVTWKPIVENVLRYREKFYTSDVVEKAELLSKSYESVFPNKRIQDVKGQGDCVLSVDANYDVKFDDMPMVMEMLGSSMWVGCMNRAKGLTRDSRMSRGDLSLMGATYEVDWKKGRIQFKYRSCSSFGYDHDVFEYMKYEERNGYVWNCGNVQYVYSKGPETTSELLFFSVVRVPSLVSVMEPRFVENPHAGRIEVESVWAVGGETFGMPTKFEKVKFHVDAVNFWKVVEKRRCLDFKGDFSATLSFVRSTNVRMWFHGTPVGATEKVEARLSEAMAVAVEVLVSRSRLETNMVFDRAMYEFDLSVKRGNWFYELLTSVVDLKQIVGSFVRPVSDAWDKVRGVVVDNLLSPLGDIKVSVRQVGPHVRLRSEDMGVVERRHHERPKGSCDCIELRELFAAIEMARGKDRIALEEYRASLGGRKCALCALDIEGFLAADEEVTETSSTVGSGSEAFVLDSDNASGRGDSTSTFTDYSEDEVDVEGGGGLDGAGSGGSDFGLECVSEDSVGVSVGNCLGLGIEKKECKEKTKKNEEKGKPQNEKKKNRGTDYAGDSKDVGGLGQARRLGAERVSKAKIHAGDGPVDLRRAEIKEVGPCWRDEENEATPEFLSMREFCELNTYLLSAEMSEIRIDATRIFDWGPLSDEAVKSHCTTRTKHAVFEVRSGFVVNRIGYNVGDVSAVYDVKGDVVHSVRRTNKGALLVNVPNGYYYTCNRMQVWNTNELVAAVSHALDYGRVRRHRKAIDVTLGVPGAGKTYGMMKSLAEEFKKGLRDFLVVAATVKSVGQAHEYGRKFGIGGSVLEERVMTMDRYLMHVKSTAKVLLVDEFPMVHIGKVDAIISLSGAGDVRLFGDAKQIPYDPFTSAFDMLHGRLGTTVDPARVRFLDISHRLPKDVCVMWNDVYPRILPCECCRADTRADPSVSYVRLGTLGGEMHDEDVRYHTFKQGEKEELKALLQMPGTMDSLRLKEKGGLSTVHEDQGTTHAGVCTYRLAAEYDKNATARNPSLYNRLNYVLTDTTRHTGKYVYKTVCEEYDLVMRRIDMASCYVATRRVDDKLWNENVTIASLLL